MGRVSSRCVSSRVTRTSWAVLQTSPCTIRTSSQWTWRVSTTPRRLRASSRSTPCASRNGPPAWRPQARLERRPFWCGASHLTHKMPHALSPSRNHLFCKNVRNGNSKLHVGGAQQHLLVALCANRVFDVLVRICSNIQPPSLKLFLVN